MALSSGKYQSSAVNRKGNKMSDNTITLTARERDLMISLLERELGDTRSEMRRTDSIDFRENVVAPEEELLRELLAKLRPATASPGTQQPG